MSQTSTEPADPELVHLDVEDGVATITLDSPPNRNALSRRLVEGLLGHLDTAEEDDAVRVVVLAATGTVFCSGADLSEASTTGMEQGARTIVEIQRRIIAHAKPVVARVQGPVRAGGIGIVAAADVAICAESATFALSEVKLGLAPLAISLSVLPRMTSRAAAWACLSGESFDAAQAADWGLVTYAVPADGLDAAVDQTCAALATGSPQGLRETKKLLARDLLDRIEERGDDLARLSSQLFGSEEAKEAMTAFLNRRR